jgi:hypothetical protein
MNKLNIFIVGPVASGKTVFSYMLNSYVQTQEGVTFRAADWKTKDHFSKIGDVLEGQDWPPSTLEGNLIKLQWEWVFLYTVAHFSLIDPPGQDIELELRGESNKLGILSSVRAADVLFLIVDLYEHELAKRNKRTQNAWIVENVLKNASSAKSLVLGLSKGDLILDIFPVEDWLDKNRVLDFLKTRMPEFNLSAYLSMLNSNKVQAVVFSSIADTENRLDVNGLLLRVPSLPLKSKNLHVFVNAITSTSTNKFLETIAKRSIRVSINFFSNPILWITVGCISILILLALLYISM